jgi:hypothetical protein
MQSEIEAVARRDDVLNESKLTDTETPCISLETQLDCLRWFMKCMDIVNGWTPMQFPWALVLADQCNRFLPAHFFNPHRHASRNK